MKKGICVGSFVRAVTDKKLYSFSIFLQIVDLVLYVLAFITDLSKSPSKSVGWSISKKKKVNTANEIFSYWNIPSTHDGAALVVPATCPGKQEHFTVCDRSSILFLLQQRCNATTSQVPVRTWWAAGEMIKKKSVLIE